MNEDSLQSDALVYASEEPDLGILTMGYQDALTNNDPFFTSCAVSYDDRNNLWPGKTWDMRKHGPNAFPWEGGSDNEVNVVGQAIDTFVSLLIQAMVRSHVRAIPTSSSSAPRASVVSGFLKYMQSTYIPGFKKQMKLGVNHLLEKSIMVSYVGWKREKRSRLQIMTLDEIRAVPKIGQELAEMILAGDADDILAQGIMDQFDTTLGRAKKAIRQLRKNGEAELPISVMSIDEPEVESLSPDGDVLFPSWTMNPQDAPYIFIRKLMTAQMIEKKVESEGWDRDWADYVIANLGGQDAEILTNERGNYGYRRIINDNKQLFLVLYTYQRLIDEIDGAEGIYCTVFNPRYTVGYAKHELVNGQDDYPIVVTRLNEKEKCLYDATPMTRNLRGPQMQIKTEVDSRTDRASQAVLPELMHPAGRPPTDRGPGRMIPYRRLGELQYGPTPPYDPGSKEIEITMRQQADRAVGLDMESPLATVRQQDVMDTFLGHVAAVLDMAWKLYQRMGPDEVFYQVSGDPTGKVMQKGSPEDNYSIVVSFDANNNDPEAADKKVEKMISLATLDRNGRLNMDRLIEMAAFTIDPVLGDHVLQSSQESADKMLRDVTDDLTKIFAGIAVPARPNGAQAALGIIGQYISQPNIQARMQADEKFAEDIKNYGGQYQFEIQQAENAQIGKIGTPPAQMGEIQTQGMQQ